MKAFLILTIAIASHATIAASTLFNRQIKPSGDVITKTYNIPASKFDKIDVSHIAKVTIVKGSGTITVNIDANIAKYLVVDLDGDELEIGLDYKHGTNGKFTFDVTVPHNGKLSEITTSGASKIESEIVLTNDNLKIDASGASKVISIIRGDKCNVEASGAANIEIAGQCETFDVNISGAARIEALIDSDRCDIEASGASKPSIEGFYEFVSINASGASKISIKGECNQAEFKASGASNIDAEDLKYNSASTNESGAAKISHTRRENKIVSQMEEDIEDIMNDVADEINDIEVEQIKAEMKKMAKKVGEKIERVIDEVKKEMKDRDDDE